MARYFNDAIAGINFGCQKKARGVSIKYSVMGSESCKILYDNGLIDSYNLVSTTKPMRNRNEHTSVIHVEFKHLRDRPFMRFIKRITHPGHRQSRQIDSIRRSCAHDTRIYIVSTSHGLMTQNNASMYNIGGESLCVAYCRG